MAIATIACPKCSQTFRSSDDVKDTRIRCPLCGFAFVVEDFVDENAPPIAKTKPKAKPAEDDAANPFGMKTVSISARCPNCANTMESETAIICLFCGYNTQSRSLGKTKKVVQQTGSDQFSWLMPGIACAAGILLLALLQHIFVLVLGADARGDPSTFSKVLYNEAVFLWLTMMLAGAMWKMGQFAFKRLILEPTPPEQVID